jgi:hypothetical protein
MTTEDYSKVPPPHLLKKFSEQAREDSNKRGHPGYCKTFAKLCIDWAFREAAMDDLRAASAEVSGAASQPGSLSKIERRSDIVPTAELIQQWLAQMLGLEVDQVMLQEGDAYMAFKAAQWGADQELEACCEWIGREGWSGESRQLRAARRPQPKSLKEQALAALERYEDEEWCEEMTFDSSIIRRALEQLPDHE